MAEVNGDSAPQTNGNNHNSPSQQTATQTSTQAASSQTAAAAATTPNIPQVPLTSFQDTGLGKRPRDARLIHMLLASMGVTAYQERVPLQLLDFAYRHTSGILSDALHFSSDAYISQQTRARDGQAGSAMKDAENQVSAAAVQLAVANRMQYQFNGGNGGGGLSKEFLLEMAKNRNKVALPRVLQNEWGVRLPSERFVMSGVPWGLKGEWIEADEEGGGDAMEGVQQSIEEGVEGGEEGEGTMEDLFGGDADQDMDKDD